MRGRLEDVHLGLATFSHCKMFGVKIKQSNIDGMTIDGIRVDLFVAAELDRRDPRRVRVRIGNVYDPAEVRRAMHELEQVRTDFISRLRAAPREHLSQIAGDWRWSALEHVRHLVFAEKLNTDRWILQNNEPYSRLGLLPDWLEGKPGYESVGTEPPADLETVLAAWARVHARTWQVVEGLTEAMLRTDTRARTFVEADMGAIFKIAVTEHEIHHIRAAEGVLAEVERQANS